MNDFKQNPIVKELLMLGYSVSAHMYVKSDRVKTSVIAKRPDGDSCQGWSDGDLDRAIDDLVERSPEFD